MRIRIHLRSIRLNRWACCSLSRPTPSSSQSACTRYLYPNPKIRSCRLRQSIQQGNFGSTASSFYLGDLECKCFPLQKKKEIGGECCHSKREYSAKVSQICVWNQHFIVYFFYIISKIRWRAFTKSNAVTYQPPIRTERAERKEQHPSCFSQNVLDRN